METFSKKEKEKQRQKKRKDKAEKKEERKANASNGRNLDEMMAYVDENGNITSHPPDPRKRREVDAEDVQIGTMKQEKAAPVDVIRQGVVTFFNTSKGYGFIKDLQNQDSIFVHINGLVDSVGELDNVTFEITMTPKGPNAVNVKKAA